LVAAPAVPSWDPVFVKRANGDTAGVYPTSDGVRVVTVGQGERVEVRLPQVGGRSYRGYQIVTGQQRPLPAGSSLDAKAGLFYWQPPAGFLGTFDLAFAGSGGAMPTVAVRVVVGPSLRLAIDSPGAGTVQTPFAIAGWAIDLAAAGGTGIDAVHAWAYPSGGGAPTFLGAALYGDARPDVATTYGAGFEGSSYTIPVNRLPRGTYDIVIAARRASTGSFDGAQTLHVTVR
jgi:hypothetical protein